MNLYLILGHTVDTYKWFEFLKDKNCKLIYCLDYELIEDYIERDGHTFVSAKYGQELISSDKFQTIQLYKSLYVYPVIR